MNNRDNKFFAPNTFHHVYNRGNGKMRIFLDEQDYLNFVKRMKLVLNVPIEHEYGSHLRIIPLPEKSFDILSYCLMPNHFHFLIRQNTAIPINKFISKLCSSFGKYFNAKYKRVGGLFQDQFKSTLIEKESYLLWLSAYIHLNPLVANIIQRAEDYQYSSYANYLKIRNDKITESNFILKIFNNSPEDYLNFTNECLKAMGTTVVPIDVKLT